MDGCRPAAVVQTGSSSLGPASSRRPPRDDQTGSSSRPNRRGQGPAEPPPQRVAKRRGRGLLPAWADEGKDKDGDERGLCC